LNVLRLLISSLPFRGFLHSMKIIKRIVYVFMARTHSLKKHWHCNKVFSLFFWFTIELGYFELCRKIYNNVSFIK
jgi:hypothetical protein